jgi:hypothetical protein
MKKDGLGIIQVCLIIYGGDIGLGNIVEKLSTNKRST